MRECTLSELQIQSSSSTIARQAYANFTFSHTSHLTSYEGNIEKVKVKGQTYYRYVCIKIGNQSFHSILDFDETPFRDYEQTAMNTTFDPPTLKGSLTFISQHDERDSFILNYCINCTQVAQDDQGRIKLNFDKFSQALKDFLTTEQRYFQMMGDS
jgi:predicted transcriptional regulator YheO